MPDRLDQRMDELVAQCAGNGWQEQSRIAFIQNEMAKEYAKIQARKKAANDQAWEVKYGRKQVNAV